MALSVASVVHGQDDEPSLSGFVRDSIDVKGKGILSTYRDTIRRVSMSIVHPYPAWLATSISDLGANTYETIGYDPILHSLHAERDKRGFPERLEIQLMDSAYLELAFHLGEGRVAEVGRFKKYYGQYTGRVCTDQEDSTWIAREKRCPWVYSDVLKAWEEPCHAPEGEWSQYWPNGRLESKGHFHPKEFEAVQYGTIEHDGEVYSIETMRSTRVKVGRWDHYDEQGQLIRTVHYEPVWLDPPYRR